MVIRSRECALLILALTVIPASPSAATVVHGDYLDSRVDFLGVQETTQTLGDPPSMWGIISSAPSLPTERTLHSTPDSFAVVGGAGGDSKVSLLEVGVSANAAHVIEEVLIEEIVLTAGSGSGSFSGTATVTADIEGPIAPVVIGFTGFFVDSDGTASIDVGAAVPGATHVDLDLTNSVDAFGGGTAASKTSADITVFLPEPAGGLSLPIGSLLLTLLQKRRERCARVFPRAGLRDD